jgi:hypothetical protein
MSTGSISFYNAKKNACVVIDSFDLVRFNTFKVSCENNRVRITLSQEKSSVGIWGVEGRIKLVKTSNGRNKRISFAQEKWLNNTFAPGAHDFICKIDVESPMVTHITFDIPRAA